MTEFAKGMAAAYRENAQRIGSLIRSRSLSGLPSCTKKDFLTEAEFTAKKAELLSRI